MSYASAYTKKPFNIKGVGMTVGVHALIIAGIMALPTISVIVKERGKVTAINVRPDPKPIERKIELKKPIVETSQPAQVIDQTAPKVAAPDFPDLSPIDFATADDAISSSGMGMINIPIDSLPDAPLPDPVIAEAKLNSRYSRDFQPDYPSGLLRLGEEGMVQVRVLVGANGRAKELQLIDTPHDGFWTATRRHALKKWRFEPATKDGKPFESWITLKVQFKINS